MQQKAPYDLVALLNRKDERAFYTVFHELYPSILTFANKFVADINIAQEVCSDSFIKLYHSNEIFEELVNVKAYLFKITRNGCLDALRKIKYQTVSQKQLQKALESNNQIFFSQQEIKSELIELIDASIEKLPPKCRRIVKMNIAGMSYEEIAHILNISINTVRNQKARGLKLLKISVLKDRKLPISSATISVMLLELFAGK